jgi:L-alanine-DL-glutamate epimerase-like enolase superfamily enzyme
LSLNIDTVKITLPLRREFVISQGKAESKTNLLTILNGRYTGEAAGSVYYGPSADDIEREIASGLKMLGEPEEITESILEDIRQLDIEPVARAALTAMFLNFLSGEQNKYPWEILNIGAPVGIRNSLTVSVGPPEDVLAAIRETDAPIIKLKLGSEHDIAVVQAIKEISDKEFRVDANGAWSCERAEEMIFYLDEAAILVVEQPTDTKHIKEWPYLKKQNENLQLIIDEGLAVRDDYDRFAEYCDGVNIKMGKSGGIVEGLRIAGKARKDKKKVMLGCMVESSVGIAQSIYMSSLADYYDLDGPQLLSEDIASGITYEKTSIEVDREIIGGPKLKREVVEKFVKS